MEWLTGIDGWAIYLAIGLLAFSESAALTGLLFPGELALVTAGAVAAIVGLDTPTLLAVAITASVLGSLFGYSVGRRRRRAVVRWGPVRRRLGSGHARVINHLSERGGLVVVISRFNPVTRALVPVLAGSAQMTLRRFVLGVTVGTLMWATVFIGGGYVAGAVWMSRSPTVVIVFGAMLALVATAVHRLVPRMPHAEPATTGAPPQIPVGTGSREILR